MTGRGSASEEFEGFCERVLEGLHPAEAPRPTPSTTIDELCGGDRLLRAMVVSRIMAIGAMVPEQVLASVETFGDAHELCRTRGQAHAPPPVDRVLGEHETGRVRLRPVRLPDFQWLYEVAANPETSYRWNYRGVTPNPQSFGESLYRGTLAQFVVERSDSHAICGLVDAYEANSAEGRAKISVVSAEGSGLPIDDGAPGLVLEGALLFISYLFRTFDLRKIYAEIPGFNWPQFASGESVIFETEGLLRAHDFFDGRYWDRHIVAIYRDRWDTFAKPWMEILNDSRRSR